MTEHDKDFSIRVFKGMNHKMNYFMDHFVVTDLSSNCPHTYIPATKEDDEVRVHK